MRDPLFNQLVKESAESVQNREDVDSVPIIDDIRYHVTLLHGDGELSGQLHDLKLLQLPAQSSFFHPLCITNMASCVVCSCCAAYLQHPITCVEPLCVAANTDDDEEDVDVLDPAQLASAYAHDQQLAQQIQEQQHQGRQQPPLAVEQCRDYSTHQAPESFQSAAAEDARLHQQPNELALQVGFGDESLGRTQGWQQLQQWHEQESQEEDELIRMDDPMFSALSERRQKLMALEEILLNTGIEG